MKTLYVFAALLLAACTTAEPETKPQPLRMFTARCPDAADVRFSAKSLSGNDDPEEATLAYVSTGERYGGIVYVARVPATCKVWADSTTTEGK